MNNKETFSNFKRDDFGSLRSEVNNMRSELNEKMDQLLEKVTHISVQNAKWMGAGGAVIFILQVVVNKFM